MDQKFLCDEMLTGLGKWLRVAGYDTLIATVGSSDRELLECAIHEKRTLLTRDRSFMQRRGADAVVFLLNDNGMASWVETLTRDLHIDWCHNPFSRCLLCNRKLEPGPGDYARQMPDYVIAKNIPCFHCPTCAKPFWEGGHVERMRRRLEAWKTKVLKPIG